MPLSREQLNVRLQAAMQEHGIVAENPEFQFFNAAGATLIACEWPIINDPERPNKRSRQIRITITRELTDMLLLAGEGDFERMLRRMLEVMERRMRNWGGPDPDAPRGQAVEPFVIQISHVEL